MSLIKGVVHRDIKPSNILVDTSGEAVRYVLADFGVSRKVEGIQTEKQVGGTIPFMAPEQFRGRAVAQSDLWALGVVAYWLWTGVLPFQGRTVGEISPQILFDTPAAPSARVGDVDGQLETLIFDLLAKDPVQRIDSAETLLKRLKVRPSSLPPAAGTEGRGVPSWEVGINRSIRRRRSICLFFAVIYGCKHIDTLIVEPALFLSGLYLIYLHQSRARREHHLLLGIILVALSWVVFARDTIIMLILYASRTHSLVDYRRYWLAPGWALLLQVFELKSYFIYFLSRMSGVSRLVAEPLFLYHFAVWKLLDRDRFLLRSLRAHGADGKTVLTILNERLERNPEDLLVRLRVAETCFAQAQLREAIIEAKLVLAIDPYNFTGSLLLAQAYAEHGLVREALAICDGYLAVSPQSFEFHDLRRRCQAAVKDMRL